MTLRPAAAGRNECPVSSAWLALCVALIMVTGCAASSTPTPAATPSPIKAGTIHFFDIANVDVRDVPMLMALDVVRSEGYTVETTYVDSSALIVAAMERGDADIGIFNNQTAWQAVGKGAAIRTVAQFTAQTTVLVIAKPLQMCADLDGKRVGQASATGLSPTLLDLYFKQHCPGITPVYLTIPNSASRAAALLAGQLDAAVLPGEQFGSLSRQAPERFAASFTYAEAYPDIMIDGIQVRKDWADNNPQTVRDYLRAVLTSYRDVAANPQVLYTEAARRLHLDAADVKLAADAHLQNRIWRPNGGMTSASIQATIDLMIQTGILPDDVSVDDVADLSYLDAVLGEIGRQ
jgi:ABC-type nitrate/sulfonate/bicarbonate transport system substrate-binding protein